MRQAIVLKNWNGDRKQEVNTIKFLRNVKYEGAGDTTDLQERVDYYTELNETILPVI